MLPVSLKFISFAFVVGYTAMKTAFVSIPKILLDILYAKRCFFDERSHSGFTIRFALTNKSRPFSDKIRQSAANCDTVTG